MRAIVITRPRGPEVLKVVERPDPVAFQEFVRKAATAAYRSQPARVFAFDEIAAAHRLMEVAARAERSSSKHRDYCFFGSVLVRSCSRAPASIPGSA